MKDSTNKQLDCEERFGIVSAGSLAAGKFSSLVLGCVLTAVFYGVLSLAKLIWSNTALLQMFFPGGAENRTLIPAITVLAAMWTLSMLLIKKSKLKLQQKMFAAGSELWRQACTESQFRSIYPEPEASVAAVMLAEQLKLHRSDLALADRLQIMENKFDDLEKELENNFIIISSFIWSIPVLGFIGTVLGLAGAVSNFGLLASGDKVSFEAVLPQITGGLATAFETTLIALVMALILQLISSFQLQSELAFAARIKAATGGMPTWENPAEEVGRQ